MGSGDATELNLTDGDVVAIELDGGTIEAKLQVADHMAAGTLIIPRHKELDWQKLGTGQTLVRKDQIRKVG
jgi:anaerobic selenocysteine-containing dehydrogenase